MRTAFISFEYAGTANGGGIGTYVRNAARMLVARGHDVEVFCAGEEAVVEDSAGVRMTYVPASPGEFGNAVREPFAARHREKAFDVVEGPEYGADAAGIRKDFPELPLIVRLHTPRAVISSINNSYVGLSSKLRFVAGALRRGIVPNPYWTQPKCVADPERMHTLEADLVVAPSCAIWDKLERVWGLPPSRSMIVPNVFIPPPELLAIDVQSGSAKTVLFLGKLEVRKGAIELAKAVPLVVREQPDVRFLMVGRSLPMPGTKRDVVELMRDAYGRASDCVQHIAGVPYADIPLLFAQAAVAVFPSTWENFPNVALEAMAAGCAVVGSSSGGMAEMIDHGRTGLLVPPRDPTAIAEALLHLLRHPQQGREMGRAARAHVLASYGPEKIGPLHEESLRRAIALARARPSRC